MYVEKGTLRIFIFLCGLGGGLGLVDSSTERYGQGSERRGVAGRRGEGDTNGHRACTFGSSQRDSVVYIANPACGALQVRGSLNAMARVCVSRSRAAR